MAEPSTDPDASDSSSASSRLRIQRYEAKPITPPQDAGVRGWYKCILDYRHKPYSITWRGSPKYPDLAKFTVLKGVDVSLVHQSLAMAAVWRDSTLLDYGSYASIRASKHSRFPILKLAHPDKQPLELIQHEFNVLVDFDVTWPTRCRNRPASNHGQWSHLWLQDERAVQTGTI
ncbi:hypothetical protein VTK56DRAFT_3647 [Thermocarpiscus australiensis]